MNNVSGGFNDYCRKNGLIFRMDCMVTTNSGQKVIDKLNDNVLGACGWSYRVIIKLKNTSIIRLAFLGDRITIGNKSYKYQTEKDFIIDGTVYQLQ